ncbi:MAG: metal ABC transporter permease [Methermicoccaceae archaeon]
MEFHTEYFGSMIEMIEILEYTFMRNALLAAVMVSIACGIVGTYVVTKRIVFISGGISHTSFGGIGLGYLIGVSPILTAIPFSILSALGIGIISKEGKLSEDTAIGILWAMGMSLGVIFINLSPGYAPDLFGYLFGNILTVPTSDLITMALLDVVIVIVVLSFFKEFSAISFDEEFSTVVGIPTKKMYLLLLCLVALSVVVMIRVVGIILVIALLTIPVAIAKYFTSNMKTLMLISILMGMILTICGLWLSYVLDLASGATIVLAMGFAFVISSIVKRWTPL